jgi:hypothetical protein
MSSPPMLVATVPLGSDNLDGVRVVAEPDRDDP